MPRALADQVVVIVGASSGIGRETALRFGRAGATVVLAARNQSGLQNVAAELESLGARSQVVVTDVAEWAQVELLAQQTEERFGRIDTWINMAGVSVYGTVADMNVHDIERTIHVDLMGQIYGMKAVLPVMRRQRSGVIMNVSSALGVRSVPLMSAYCAAKHGINGFTESLRMELQYEKSGIDVVLVLPASMNTPLFRHARSRLGVLPKPVPPVYEPSVVAEAIVAAAQKPQRDVYAGGAGKGLSVLASLAPSLLDRFMVLGGTAFKQQKSDQPDNGVDNLDRALEELGSVRDQFERGTMSRSLYTRHLELHPNRKRALIGVALALLGQRLRKSA